MVSYNSGTTLTLGLASRTTDTNVIMLPRKLLSHLQSYLSLIHPEFLRLLWVLADMQTVKYFNLVGDEDDIGNERFKWSRASTFSYNRNAIGLAIAYASAIRTHLSVHGTAHPMSAASVRPRSAAALSHP